MSRDLLQNAVYLKIEGKWLNNHYSEDTDFSINATAPSR